MTLRHVRAARAYAHDHNMQAVYGGRAEDGLEHHLAFIIIKTFLAPLTLMTRAPT